jgi:hypothetical protein
MTDRQREETSAFYVTITFHSAGESFATETYTVLAPDEFEAERLGREQARGSVYHDERVPSLGLAAVVEEDEDPPEPDDEPPAAAAGYPPAAP